VNNVTSRPTCSCISPDTRLGQILRRQLALEPIEKTRHRPRPCSNRLCGGADRLSLPILRARGLRLQPFALSGAAERKIGALDQAAPLVRWELPAEFATLRRLLEARMGKPGKREFVQVLRLPAALLMDLAKSLADTFRRIPAISAAGDAIRVRACAQIACTRALCERFSESCENWRTEWWSEGDSNSPYRFLNWQTTAFRRRLQHNDESRFG
jgi:hypothetical protein